MEILSKEEIAELRAAFKKAAAVGYYDYEGYYVDTGCHEFCIFPSSEGTALDVTDGNNGKVHHLGVCDTFRDVLFHARRYLTGGVK